MNQFDLQAFISESSKVEKGLNAKWQIRKKQIFTQGECVNIEDVMSFVFDSHSLVVVPIDINFESANQHFIDLRDIFDVNIGVKVPWILDKLIGRWLKFKNYPIKEAADRLGLEIGLSDDWKYYVSAFVLLQDVLSTAIPHLKMDNNTPPYRSGPYDLNISNGNITNRNVLFFWQYPFAWIWIILESSDAQLTMSDIECSAQFWKLESTSNPLIYLLILSFELDSDKDCAKVLQEYFLKPKRFDLFNPTLDLDDTYNQVELQSKQPARAYTLNHTFTPSSHSQAVADFKNSDQSNSDHILNRLYDDMLRNAN